jgi:hypothetical protein
MISIQDTEDAKLDLCSSCILLQEIKRISLHLGCKCSREKTLNRTLDNTKLRFGFITGSCRRTSPKYCPKRITAVRKRVLNPPVQRGWHRFFSELCHGGPYPALSGENSGYLRGEKIGDVKVKRSSYSCAYLRIWTPRHEGLWEVNVYLLLSRLSY